MVEQMRSLYRLSAVLVVCWCVVCPASAQSLEEPCSEQQTERSDVYFKNARKYWQQGDRQSAVDEAYQGWQECSHFIPGGLHYVDYLRAVGSINIAMSTLETLSNGYPEQSRYSVDLTAASIRKDNGALSFVVVGRAGYLEPLDIEVEIQGSGLTETEMRSAEECEEEIVSTPAHPEEERLYYLAPGRYNITVLLDDDRHPSPDSLERDAQGRPVLFQGQVDVGAGDLERVDLKFRQGGDRNNIFLTIVGGLAWFMFR